MSQDDRLTVDDIIRAGGCPRGIRTWFAGNAEKLPAGLTMRAFLDDGISHEEAEALDDPFIQRALALKESDRGR